jgi:hypothetical protein
MTRGAGIARGFKSQVQVPSGRTLEAEERRLPCNRESASGASCQILASLTRYVTCCLSNSCHDPGTKAMISF